MRWNSRHRHDLAVAEVRAPVGEPELVGSAPLGAVGGADRDPLEGPGELAAVGVGVHPDRPADGAGDVDPELEAAEAPAGRLRGGRRQADAGAAEQALAVALDPRQLTIEFEDQSSKSIVRYEKVRSRAHHSYRGALRPRAAPGARSGPPPSPARANMSADPPARTVVRRARSKSRSIIDSGAALTIRPLPPRARSPSRKTSPAPSVTSTSPSREPVRRAPTPPGPHRRATRPVAPGPRRRRPRPRRGR